MIETYWNLIKEKIMALDTKAKVLIALVVLLLISMIWTSMKVFLALLFFALVGYGAYWLYERARNE